MSLVPTYCSKCGGLIELHGCAHCIGFFQRSCIEAANEIKEHRVQEAKNKSRQLLDNLLQNLKDLTKDPCDDAGEITADIYCTAPETSQALESLLNGE